MRESCLVSLGQNLAGTSGTSGAYSWVLRNPGVDLTAWDLCVGNCDAPVDTDGDGIQIQMTTIQMRILK